MSLGAAQSSPGTAHVLLSAYTVDPRRGSEPGVGFHWIGVLLDAGCRVTALVHQDRGGGVEYTAGLLGDHLRAGRLRLLAVSPGPLARGLRAIPGAWYLGYRCWQLQAAAAARKAIALDPPDWIHHVSFNGYREPGFLHRLGRPFVWGPIGGVQNADPRLVRLQGALPRAVEAVRSALNRWCAAHAARPRAARAAARVVLAANPEATAWARRGRGAIVLSLLETAVETVDPPPATVEGRSGALWVGSDEPRKNPEFALLAHALLRRCVPQTGLSLVGLGPSRERSLRAWAHGRGIDLAGVRFLARQSRAELAGLYRSARLFWFTSYRDTSGNVLLEAMASGAVPVAFAQQGAASILAGGAGELVPLAAMRAMLSDWVRRSRRLMCNERAWAVMAQAATIRVEGRYRWEAKWPALRPVLQQAGVWPAVAASSPSSAPTARASRPPSPACAVDLPPLGSLPAPFIGAYRGANRANRAKSATW